MSRWCDVHNWPVAEHAGWVACLWCLESVAEEDEDPLTTYRQRREEEDESVHPVA